MHFAVNLSTDDDDAVAADVSAETRPRLYYLRPYTPPPPVSAPAAEIINLSRISAASARNLAGGQMLRRLQRLDEVVNGRLDHRAGPCSRPIVPSRRAAKRNREQRLRHGHRGR